LVEAKSSGTRWIYDYQEALKVPHTFQIGFQLAFVDKDCIE